VAQKYFNYKIAARFYMIRLRADYAAQKRKFLNSQFLNSGRPPPARNASQREAGGSAATPPATACLPAR